jgi:hypothetical protein
MRTFVETMGWHLVFGGLLVISLTAASVFSRSASDPLMAFVWLYGIAR